MLRHYSAKARPMTTEQWRWWEEGNAFIEEGGGLPLLDVWFC